MLEETGYDLENQLDPDNVLQMSIPTEVFIKKKRAHCFCLMSKYHSQRNHVVVFYQEQQKIATGSEDGYARAARISPAEGA